MPEFATVLGEYVDHARDLLLAGQLTDAASYYTAAAYGNLMRFQRSPTFVEEHGSDGTTYPVPGQVGKGVRELLLAALCYRIADAPGRAANRSRQGILVVEDLREHDPIFERTTHQGWCYEAIGDLRLFGDLDDHDEAYCEAERRYEGTDNPIQWLAETEFEVLIQPVIRLAESVGRDIPDKTVEDVRRRSLTDRIEYKRTHYPDIVAAVVEAGNWDAVTL